MLGSWTLGEVTLGETLSSGNTGTLSITEDSDSVISTAVTSIKAALGSLRGWDHTNIGTNNDNWSGLVEISGDGSLMLIGGYSSNLWTSSNKGLVWTEQTGSGVKDWGYFASSYDGNLLAAIAYGDPNIYTSTDRGVTWVQRTNAATVAVNGGNWNALAISPDGSKIYAAEWGGYVNVSSDNGATWTQLTNSGVRNWRSKLAVSNNGSIVYAVGYVGVTPAVCYVMKSVDSGSSWTDVNPGGVNLDEIACSSDGNKVVAVTITSAATKAMYVSNDGGATFPTIVTNMTNYYDVAMSSDGSAIFVAADDGTNKGLNRTTNDGTSWTKLSPGWISYNSIDCTADGNVAVMLDYGNYFVDIYDGTTVWLHEADDVTLSATAAIALKADTSTAEQDDTLSSSATLKITANYKSATVIDPNSAGTATYGDGFSAISGDGSIYLIGENPGYLYVADGNNGQNWIARATDASDRNWYVFGASYDGNVLLAATAWDTYGVYTSTDRGVTWVLHSGATTAGSNNNAWNCAHVSGDGLTLFVAEYNGYIVRSTDGGSTWTRLTSGLPSGGVATWNGITSSHDGSIVYAICNAGALCYKSIDGGTTWTAISGFSEGAFGISTSSDGQTVVAVNSSVWTDNVNLSTDGGATWVGLEAGPNSVSDVKISADGLTIIANGYNSPNSGLYRSIDQGKSWTFEYVNSSYYHLSISADGTKALSYDGSIGKFVNYVTNWTNIVEASDTVSSAATLPIKAGGSGWIDKTSMIGSPAMSGDGSLMVLLSGSTNGYTSSNRGDTWKSQPGIGTGQWKVKVSRNGNLIVALDNTNTTPKAKPWYSTDRGVTWAQMNYPITLSDFWIALAVSGDGSTVYAVNYADKVIYKTTNLGVSWTATAFTVIASVSDNIATNYDGSVVVAACNNSTLLQISTDGGTTCFNAPGTSATQFAGVCVSDDGQKIFAYAAGNAGQNYAWKSVDGGATFTYQDFNIGTTYPQDHKVLMSGDGSTLVDVGFSGAYFTVISKDFGASWVEFVDQHGIFNWNATGAISTDGSLILLESTSAVKLFSGQYDIIVEDGDTVSSTAKLLIQTISRIGYKQTNSGDNGFYWADKAGISGDGSLMMMGEYSSNIVGQEKGWPSTSNDGGITWVRHTTGVSQLTWDQPAISYDGNIAYMLGNGSVYKSTDRGVSWTAMTNSNAVKSGGSDWQYLRCSSDGSVIYAIQYGNIGYSLDAGATWSTIASVTSLAVNPTDAALSSDGVIAYYATDAGDLYKSTNSGSTFSLATSVAGVGWRFIYCSRNGQYVVGTVSGAPGVYRSDDYGATFTQISSTLDGKGITISDDGQIIYVFANNVVNYSIDGGATWGADITTNYGNQIDAKRDGSLAFFIDYNDYTLDTYSALLTTIVEADDTVVSTAKVAIAANRGTPAAFDDVNYNVDFDDDHLTAYHNTNTDGGSNEGLARSTQFRSTGKFYIEFTVGLWGNGDDGAGVCLASASALNVGSDGLDCVTIYTSGNIYGNGAYSGKTIGGGISAGDIIGLAIDFDNRKAWFNRNGGSWNGNLTDDPETGAGGVTVGAGSFAPCVSFHRLATGQYTTLNSGSLDFAHPVPSGFAPGWFNSPAGITEADDTVSASGISAVRISDDFNRADSALEDSPIMSSGAIWRKSGAISGGATISGNQLANATSDAEGDLYYYDLQNTNQWVKFKLLDLTANSFVVLRSDVSFQNYIGVRASGSNFQIWKRTTATSFVNIYNADHGVVSGDVFEVSIWDSDNIKVLKNGTEIISFNMGVTLTGTNVGVQVRQAVQNPFIDDFEAAIAVQAAAAITEQDDVSTISADLQITADLTIVEDDDTVSSSSMLPILASLDITTEDDTLGASTTLLIQADVSIVQDDDTLVSAATVYDSVHWAADITEEDDTLTATAGLGISATVSITEVGDTSTSSAITTRYADLQVTEENDTLATAATSSITASANITEDDDTLTTLAFNTHIATFAATEDDDTVSSTARVVAGASLNKYEDDDTVSSVATNPIIVNTTLVEANDTLVATGTHPIVATVNITEQNDTLLSATKLKLVAASSLTEASDTIASTALSPVLATVAITEDSDTIVSVATNPLIATVAITEDNDTNLGVAANPLVGTDLTIEADDILSATGTIQLVAALSITEDNDSITSVASNPVLANVSVVEDNDTLAAVGTNPVKAVSANTELNDTLSSAATVSIKAASAIIEQNDTLTFVTSLPVLATAAFTEVSDTVVSSATNPLKATVAIVEADDTPTISAKVLVKAASAIVEDDDTVNATLLQSAFGVVDQTDINDTLSATGTLSIAASANIPEANDSVSSAAKAAIAAFASMTEQADVTSSAAKVNIAGNFQVVEGGDSLSASAAINLSAWSAISEDNDTLSATGMLLSQGISIRVEDNDTLIATAKLIITATAIIIEQDDVISSISRLPIRGFASITEQGDVTASAAEIDIAAVSQVVEDDDILSSAAHTTIHGAANIIEADDTIYASSLVNELRLTIIEPNDTFAFQAEIEAALLHMGVIEPADTFALAVTRPKLKVKVYVAGQWIEITPKRFVDGSWTTFRPKVHRQGVGWM